MLSLGKFAAFLSMAAFGLFLVNIIIGKVKVMTGQGVAPPIDGVAEFLLLTAAVIAAAIWLGNQEKN